MKQTLLVGIVMLFSFSAGAGTSCEPSADNCGFYSCLEEQMGCGSQGYLQDFALPYCETYEREQERYTPIGKIWLSEVRLCLQEELRRASEGDGEFGEVGLSCNSMRPIAVQSHESCYHQTGFCQIPAIDKFRVMKTAYREVFQTDFMAVFLSVLRSCD